MIHRNTFINAPRHIDATLRLRKRPQTRLAGQITGVEGYVESAATGLLAARFVLTKLAGEAPQPPPPETALGGLMRHLNDSNPRRFQPANINWGLIARTDETAHIKGKRERREAQARLALERVARWSEALPAPAKSDG